MASYDFQVDLQALVAAARGSAETVALVKAKDVGDFLPTQGDVDSDVVWAALEEFGDRWDRGMNNLVRDIEEMAGRLGTIAMSYAEFDRTGSERMAALAGSMRAVRVLG